MYIYVLCVCMYTYDIFYIFIEYFYIFIQFFSSCNIEDFRGYTITLSLIQIHSKSEARKIARPFALENDGSTGRNLQTFVR